MLDQLLISGLFGGLLFGLGLHQVARRAGLCLRNVGGLFCRARRYERSAWIRPRMPALSRSILLLLVSTGLEKLSWLSRLSDKLIVQELQR